MYEGQQDAAERQRDSNGSVHHGEYRLADTFADKCNRREQVIEVVKHLDDAFHCGWLADNGQHGAAGLGIAPFGVLFVE